MLDLLRSGQVAQGDVFAISLEIIWLSALTFTSFEDVGWAFYFSAKDCERLCCFSLFVPP